MEDLEQDDAAETETAGLQVELIGSYLSFGRRAIRARWALSLAVFVAGIGLTLATFVLFPRTYHCISVMMALGNAVLERYDAPNPLAGAESLIMRHDNLEAIIRDTGLLRNYDLRRPPLLKVKDRIVDALVGAPSEKLRLASLVGTLEAKLVVTADKGELGISVDWSDGQTAADLVEAARKSFLNARHSAEVSAFEDKMAILDGHATTLREEIAALAEQMNAGRQNAAAAVPAQAPRPVAVRVAPRTPSGTTVEELSELREKLAIVKPKLAELENDHSRRLREEQGKLAEMKLRLTPSHPEVVTEEGKVAMLAQMPADVAQLKGEVTTLEADIKARELVASRGASATASGASATAEPLPAEIINVLEKEDADPALRAQLSGAVVKYGDLRDGTRSARIELDTAQAAFNHRYQVVVPAEAPSKPDKPKPALILGGGLAVTLLLALLLPVLGQLKKGVIIERWQVQHLQLPVLAELELPPHTD